MADVFKCQTDHREGRFDPPITFPVPDDAKWEQDIRNGHPSGFITTTVQCPECGADVKLMKQDKESVDG